MASPLILNTEIIVHRSQNDCENSTSVDTLIDSDLEIKPVLIFIFYLYVF